MINALLERIPNSARLITTTTRTPREGDVHGNRYNFISEEEFKNKISKSEFLEYNIYAGNYYGSERKILEKALERFTVVLSQIEVNGKHNLDKLGIKNLSIFLLPESLDVLRKRIEKRGGIPKEIIQERLTIAEKEIADSGDYNYRVYNKEGKLEETIAEIEQIITTELGKTLTLDKKANFS